MRSDGQHADLTQLKERVRDATDLADLVGERTVLSGPRHDRRGCCPLHDGKNPTSLSVNAAKGVWHCHSCDASGDCFDWMEAVEGIEFAEALRILAERAGIRLKPDAPLPAPPEDPVEQLAAVRGWDLDALRALGARSEEGRDGRRIVAIPMRDSNGEAVGWRERGADNRSLPVGRGQAAKSKTRKGTSLGLFYPPDPRECNGPWLVVEGEADAAAALSAGHHATVGTAGASASRESLAWLQELLRGREVVLAPDPDGAGRRWRDRLATQLRNAGCQVRLIVPIGDRDLDDRLRAAEDPRAELAQLVAGAEAYEPPEEELELAAFLDDEGRPVLPRIAERLHAERQFFSIGGRPGRSPLYRYSGGVYVPHGIVEVGREVTRLLGERYRPTHASGVIDMLTRKYAQPGGDDQIDPNPQLLNVANGLLDVETLKLHDHDPNYLSILQVPHLWLPDADCPRIDAFIRQVWPEDSVELAYEVFGYILRRDLSYEKCLLMLGEGENGKSLTIQTAQELVGRRNYSTVPAQDLDGNRFAAAGLVGKLLNSCADIPPRAFEETVRFKAVVTGEPIRAERKHQHPFDFTPYCVLVFGANEVPATSDLTYAFYRRWLPVEFNHRFVGPDNLDRHNQLHRPARDRRELLAELTDPNEQAGLLRRSLEAARRLVDRGHFTEPESVQRAKSRFRRESNSVAWFVEDTCEVGAETSHDGRPVHWVSRQELFGTYKKWAEDNDFDGVSQRDFNARLGAVDGIDHYRPVLDDGSRPKSWRGIALVATESRGPHQQ